MTSRRHPPCDGCGHERADVSDYAGGNYCLDCIASYFDDEPRPTQKENNE